MDALRAELVALPGLFFVGGRVGAGVDRRLAVLPCRGVGITLVVLLVILLAAQLLKLVLQRTVLALQHGESCSSLLEAGENEPLALLRRAQRSEAVVQQSLHIV